MASVKFLVRQDGSKTAYEILGNDTTKAEPIVLVGGLSNLRGHWERLIPALAKDRQVLIFDNRGIGDSTFSTSGDEILTIELMARDLFDLLVFLGWKNISICGFSMGGLITQQLLLLPYIANNPTPLPFRVTHVILAGTLTGPKNKEPGFKFSPQPPLNREMTPEEKRELWRSMLEATLDPKWINENPKRLNELLDRMNTGSRPMRTISKTIHFVFRDILPQFDFDPVMQARAIDGTKLEEYYPKLPMDTKVLVIHGKLDKIVPFSYSFDILKHIPWAKRVEVGPGLGQIENLDFGHLWSEYFDVDVWYQVITRFLNDSTTDNRARL